MKIFIWQIFETMLYIIGFIVGILSLIGLISSFINWDFKFFISTYNFLAENMRSIRLFLLILFVIGLLRAAILSDWREEENERTTWWQ